MVNHTECSQSQSFRIDQGNARVKSDMRFAHDQRIVGKSFVLFSVTDDEGFVLENRMGTERDLAWRLLLLHSHSRFEPLPGFVHQGNHGDGNLANVRGQGGDIVIGLLSPSIENVIFFQGRESFGFIGWQRGILLISMAFNAG